MEWAANMHAMKIMTCVLNEVMEGRTMTSFFVDTYQDSVEGRRRPTSLYMSQDSGSRVKSKPVSHKLQQTIFVIIARIHNLSNFILVC